MPISRWETWLPCMAGRPSWHPTPDCQRMHSCASRVRSSANHYKLARMVPTCRQNMLTRQLQAAHLQAASLLTRAGCSMGVRLELMSWCHHKELVTARKLARGQCLPQ